MPRISGLPQDAVPTTTDYVPGVQASVPGTVRFLLSNLIALFWTLANIPAGGTSPITRDNESQFAFVASGMVWSGDAYASTRNASMTAGVCYINGRRISISAVTARTFTASKDTYIDVLDNQDGTGTLVYTEVTNGAASPSLASNSLRIGLVVTGASNIAASSSITQSGQDSLGNNIHWASATYPSAGSSKITTSESRANASYGALTTAQAITIKIGPNGIALVIVRCQISNNTNSGGGCMSFVASGANTQAASDTYCVSTRFPTAANAWQISGNMFLLTGFAAGITTFTAQFRSLGADTASFGSREIAAVAL